MKLLKFGLPPILLGSVISMSTVFIGLYRSLSMLAVIVLGSILIGNLISARSSRDDSTKSLLFMFVFPILLLFGWFVTFAIATRLSLWQ